MNYGYNPRAPIDLVSVLDLVCKNKIEGFIKQLKKIHTTIEESMKNHQRLYK